jgi:hypothetical protein
MQQGVSEAASAAMKGEKVSDVQRLRLRQITGCGAELRGGD